MPLEIVELSTDDPDLAHHTLNEIYVPERPIQFRGTAERFECSLRAMQIGELHAGRFRHTLRT